MMRGIDEADRVGIKTEEITWGLATNQPNPAPMQRDLHMTTHRFLSGYRIPRNLHKSPVI